MIIYIYIYIYIYIMIIYYILCDIYIYYVWVCFTPFGMMIPTDFHFYRLPQPP